MAKKPLDLSSAVTQPKKKRTAFDLADEATTARKTDTNAIPESPTDRVNVSLLEEERKAMDDRAHHFKITGRRDLKFSRLARIAFKMLLEAPDEEILKLADSVDNLEVRRGRK